MQLDLYHLQTWISSVKALTVNGVAPSEQTVSDGYLQTPKAVHFLNQRRAKGCSKRLHRLGYGT